MMVWKEKPHVSQPQSWGGAEGVEELSWAKPDRMDSSFLLKEPGWSQHRGNLELFTRL